MYPFQGKNLGVVEIAEPVNSIMAVQTARPKLFQVPGHETRPTACGWVIPGCMTIYTPLNFKAGIKISGMTILANHRITLVILDMPVQTEPRLLIVFERLAVQECWRPPVLVMAFLTIGWEHGFVNLRFSVAGRTIGRGAAECLHG